MHASWALAGRVSGQGHWWARKLRTGLWTDGSHQDMSYLRCLGQARCVSAGSCGHGADDITSRSVACGRVGRTNQVGGRGGPLVRGLLATACAVVRRIARLETNRRRVRRGRSEDEEGGGRGARRKRPALAGGCGVGLLGARPSASGPGCLANRASNSRAAARRDGRHGTSKLYPTRKNHSPHPTPLFSPSPFFVLPPACFPLASFPICRPSSAPVDASAARPQPRWAPWCRAGLHAQHVHAPRLPLIRIPRTPGRRHRRRLVSRARAGGNVVSLQGGRGRAG